VGDDIAKSGNLLVKSALEGGTKQKGPRYQGEGGEFDHLKKELTYRTKEEEGEDL